MNTLVARGISYLFHPLLLATYLFGMLAVYFPPALYPIKMETRFYFVVFVCCLTFVLPALNLFFFRQFGVITTLTMKHRSERIKPFIFITLLYLGCTGLFYYKSHMGLQDNVFKLLVIIDALVVVSLVITLFYKASIHSLAACGVLGILLPLTKAAEDGSLLLPFVCSLTMAGLIMTARLQLQAHTPRQILAGAATGFATGFVGMMILF